MIVLFILTLAVSFIVVRVGAIAFQLTGLEWSLAKFQSLSCFTGTGFTTKEAELITGNPQRRRIASILMVLGNAGLVTLILTGASTIISEEDILSALSKSYLPFYGAQIAKFVNIVMLAAAVIVVYKIFTNKKVTLKLTNFLREKIVKKEFFQRVSFEELLLATGGYGVSRVKVFGESPVLNKTLRDADLRRHDITVLAIVRGEETIANPGADKVILRGDELVCFGRLENIRSVLCPPSAARAEAAPSEPEKKEPEKPEPEKGPQERTSE
jgi:hypothetical protein